MPASPFGTCDTTSSTTPSPTDECAPGHEWVDFENHECSWCECSWFSGARVCGDLEDAIDQAISGRMWDTLNDIKHVLEADWGCHFHCAVGEWVFDEDVDCCPRCPDTSTPIPSNAPTARPTSDETTAYPTPIPGTPVCNITLSGFSLGFLDGEYGRYGDWEGYPYFHNRWSTRLRFDTTYGGYAVSYGHNGAPYCWCVGTETNEITECTEGHWICGDNGLDPSATAVCTQTQTPSTSPTLTTYPSWTPGPTMEPVDAPNVSATPSPTDNATGTPSPLDTSYPTPADTATNGTESEDCDDGDVYVWAVGGQCLWCSCVADGRDDCELFDELFGDAFSLEAITYFGEHCDNFLDATFFECTADEWVFDVSDEVSSSSDSDCCPKCPVTTTQDPEGTEVVGGARMVRCGTAVVISALLFFNF